MLSAAKHLRLLLRMQRVDRIFMVLGGAKRHVRLQLLLLFDQNPQWRSVTQFER
jgi:hypothetical protein